MAIFWIIYCVGLFAALVVMLWREGDRSEDDYEDTDIDSSLTDFDKDE